ncbi:MAG: bestrophin family protein [Nostoc sp. ChiQUE02]|uniref:bestrophin family protein n=1 Tax=Nostoc sp. ChiQUE02 TaxID=3075377 RepID=UPI002AD48D65|nr:bestrophin family ion channel [Nostoc sp. ChiQUE02]MDZ8233760.1 bestrophin family ion channel [Nostoc sp. ChiQUE02]
MWHDWQIIGKLRIGSRGKMKLIRRSTWLDLAIDLRSSVIHAIWRRVLATMIFALIIAIAYHKGFAVNQPTLAGLIPGVVLGLLLVFRTNTAYERFWEGCKIWYNLLSASRILCRNIWVIVPVNNPEHLRRKISNIRLVGLLIIAIKSHLRNQNIDDATFQEIITQEQRRQLKVVNNIPLKIINLIAEYFGQLFDERADISNMICNRSFIELNRSLDQITMLIGDCQRILDTPLPRSYSIHLKHLLLLYCFALPFQFVQALDWFTIPTVGIISFALLGIEDIGVEIENPFGYDINDLPLDRFCQELQAEIETEWINCEPNFSYYDTNIL